MKLSNLDSIQAVNKEEQELTGGYYGGYSDASASGRAVAFSYDYYASKYASVYTDSGVDDYSAYASSSSYASVSSGYYYY